MALFLVIYESNFYDKTLLLEIGIHKLQRIFFVLVILYFIPHNNFG